MNRIARAVAVTGSAMALSLAVASPAQASTWRPHMVALPRPVAADARALYGAACSSALPPIHTAEGDFAHAFCNPRQVRLNRQAGRLGYCFRWAAKAPRQISATCLADVEYLMYA